MGKLRVRVVQARRVRWAARAVAAFSVLFVARFGVHVSGDEVAAGLVAFDAVLQLFVTEQLPDEGGVR